MTFSEALDQLKNHRGFISAGTIKQKCKLSKMCDQYGIYPVNALFPWSGCLMYSSFGGGYAFVLLSPEQLREAGYDNEIPFDSVTEDVIDINCDSLL